LRCANSNSTPQHPRRRSAFLSALARDQCHRA
jgi:hypothetical protein